MTKITQRLALVLGMGCLLLADEAPKHKVQWTHTDRFDLPAGGQLRFKDSAGELHVEAWDRSDVEMTTIKTTKDEIGPRKREQAGGSFDQVKVSAQRQGDDLVVTTDIAWRHRFLPIRPRNSIPIDLEYRVKAPRNAMLVVNHDSGEVHVIGLTSDIRVRVSNGGMTLQLAPDAQYAIDAKTDIGAVNSDFPGIEKRGLTLFGHKFIQSAQAPHKLVLRAGYGDITILKINTPAEPAPASH